MIFLFNLYLTFGRDGDYISSEGKIKKKSMRIKRTTESTRRKKKAEASPPSSQVSLRVAIAQMNSVVGDFQQNVDRIKEFLGKAVQCGADLILFPERALTGYPPEDLLLKNDFTKKMLKL